MIGVALLLASLLLVQDQDPEPIQGPLTDAIVKRFDALQERLAEREGFLARLIQESEERQKARQDQRFSRLLEWLDANRPEPFEAGPLLESIKQMRADFRAEMAEAKTLRSGMLSRLAEMRDEVAVGRSERKTLLERIAEQRAEMSQLRAEWRPLQGLVDRLTSFVWKLLWLGLSIIAVLLILGGILYWVYIKIIATVTTIPAQIFERLVKQNFPGMGS